MPSSVIKSFSYDAAIATLFITYVSGIVYRYLNVPLRIYEGIKNATSKGRYLNLNIKGKYNFVKSA